MGSIYFLESTREYLSAGLLLGRYIGATFNENQVNTSKIFLFVFPPFFILSKKNIIKTIYFSKESYKSFIELKMNDNRKYQAGCTNTLKR